MRSVLLAVALLLAAAPGARAENVAEPAVPERVPPVMTADAPDRPAMVLQEVRIAEQRSDAEAVAEQDMPRRGSFWWLVGVIVVAGVVLAVLL